MAGADLSVCLCYADRLLPFGLLEGMLTCWRRGKTSGRNEQPRGMPLPSRCSYNSKLAPPLTAQKGRVGVLRIVLVETQVV